MCINSCIILRYVYADPLIASEWNAKLEFVVFKYPEIT